jgi:hypothetical protein
MSKLVDLTGLTFGRLKVINRELNGKNGKTLWNCQCSCGNTKIVQGGSLKNGDIKSCGCLKDEKKLKNGEAAFNALYQTYKNRGYRKNKKSDFIRDLPFELEKNDFREIVTKNCFYCGLVPSQIKYNSKSKFIYNGIDRLDSSKGYTIDNSVPCCKKCNRNKWDYSYKDFLEWVERVYDHSIKNINL